MSSGLPNVIFVLGGPGAGKGTQCVKIVQVLNYFKQNDLNILFDLISILFN